MKRRLNILCVLVFLVLGISLYNTVYQFGEGIKAGVNLAEQKKSNIKKFEGKEAFGVDYRKVDVVPTDAMWSPDSILNVQTGKKIPVLYSQLLLKLERETDQLNLVVGLVCSLLNILLTLIALIIFVLLILNINKSRIFEWKNVSRLRWLGGLLIGTFICNFLPEIISYWGIDELLKIDRYMVAPMAIQLTDLFLGLGCFIVAEAFAIGLNMKEEQDLTI